MKKAFDKIQRQFTSTNSIDVERATVLHSDWELAKQYMTSRAQGEPASEVQSSECSTCNGAGGTYEPKGHRDAMLFVCPDCDGSGDAPEPSAGTVPDGWKLVPIEPTVNQVGAAESPVDDVVSMRQSSQHEIARAAYRAMIDAAPQPPQEGE